MRVEDELTGEGLRLLPMRGIPEHVAFLARMAADPLGSQWSRSLRRLNAGADPQAWIDERTQAEGCYEWVVEDEATGVILGRVGLHRSDPDLALEVGYWTLPEARGERVAGRATRLVTRYGHARLGQQRIALLHAVANPRSCRVALAASFPYEGTLRGLLDHGDGVLWDAHLHARLADDPWDALAPPPLPVDQPEIAADGLVLRPWHQGMAPQVADLAGDPELARWSPVPQGGPEQAARWLDAVGADPDSWSWAVHDTASGTLLGGVSLHHVDPHHARAQVGYWVAPGGRGRGVATEAVRAVTAYVFESLALERVALYHAVENLASCGVACNAGYPLEGTVRRGYRYPDGVLHDEHLHGRVRSDP